MLFTKDLIDKVGSLKQIAGIQQYQYADGPARGVRVLDFSTGTGFRFQVLVDRGFDVYNASFAGLSLDWRSATGVVSPAFFEPGEFGWLRGFFGGLVATCGLTQAGAPNVDQNERLGLHGRVGNTPASLVEVREELKDGGLCLKAEGEVRETSVFGHQLSMRRIIRARAGESRFFLEDRFLNTGSRPSPFMILYHINLGYPVVDDGSRLLSSESSITPRDAAAEKGAGKEKIFIAPECGFNEEVFFYDMKTDAEGSVCAAVANEARELLGLQGLGLYVKYPKAELPRFSEWKMMGCGEYVVGVEPGNCHPWGRKTVREKGELEYLQPGESRAVHLEIGVLAGRDEIEAFERRLP